MSLSTAMATGINSSWGDPNPPKRQVATHIPKEDFEKLKAEALKQGVPISEILHQLISLL